MHRKEFIRQFMYGLFALPTLRTLARLSEQLPHREQRMPALFLGHGSPMNALEDNSFTRGWQALAAEIPEPEAILCISAHWETNGTYVTAMEKPRTIHDFGGFPQELYEVQYPAPGSPSLAKETAGLVQKTEVKMDQSWGFDHGSWAVVNRIYPDADVPMIQLSLNRRLDAQGHYELAQELRLLRQKGVLIIGSGNMVHNLRMLNWRNPEEKYDWAETANSKFKALMESHDHQSLIRYSGLGSEAALAIPTPEHFLPLLYVLGLQEEDEQPGFFNDQTVMGSISMTSVRIG